MFSLWEQMVSSHFEKIFMKSTVDTRSTGWNIGVLRALLFFFLKETLAGVDWILKCTVLFCFFAIIDIYPITVVYEKQVSLEDF